MRTKAITLVALTLFVSALSACAAPTPAPTSAPAPAATTAPAPGGSGASTMPAQPTLPPVAPRQATPFVTATPAPVLNYPAPTRASTASAGGAATAAPTSAAAAQTPASGPTAPGVATGQRVELKLEFVKQLVSAEEVDEIAPILKAVPGIFSVTGNEVSITVLYDPGLILPNQIRSKLTSMGHAVKE